MSKTILFFGNERLATGVSTTCPALRALLEHGYDVAAVVVAQNDTGRSRQPRRLEVAELAREHDIPVIAPGDLAAARDELAAYGARAAVLIAYGKIVPPQVLDIFPGGIVNVHPSLLPLHRGSTPIENVILDGSAETGVSLMKLTEKMDAGPVYEKITVPLQGDEAKQALAGVLAGLGTELLLKYLPGILDGSGQAPAPQGDVKAAPDEHITKEDGVIDWSKPAARLEREVRAYAGWPRSRTELGPHRAIITRAAVTTDETALRPGEVRIAGNRLLVGTGKGRLEILSLIPDGKREMAAAAFMAGYKL